MLKYLLIGVGFMTVYHLLLGVLIAGARSRTRAANKWAAEHCRPYTLYDNGVERQTNEGEIPDGHKLVKSGGVFKLRKV